MYSCQSLLVPVYAYAASRSYAALACRWPSFSSLCSLVSPVYCRMTKSHLTATLFKVGAQFLDTFQVRRCWIKINSAVNLREKPSVEFVQCVLWVILLMKTIESICSAVCPTVTLPSCLTNNTLTTFSLSSDCYDDWHRPSPAVRHQSYDASSLFRRCRLLCSVSMCLLLSACCWPLATSFWWYSRFYTMLQSHFSLLYLLVFP